MKKKKINPRRRPMTEADVSRAKKEAQSKSIDACWAIFFTVLRDKEGMEEADLRRIWNHVNKLSEEITDGRISVWDLMNTLKEEAGLVLGNG